MPDGYPNLERLSSGLHCGVDIAHFGRLQTVSREIQARTGCEAWFDTSCREIVFGTRDAHGRPRTCLGLPLFVPGSVPPYPIWFDGQRGGPLSVDSVCEVIQRARKVPFEDKMAESKREEDAREAEKKKAERARMEEIHRDSRGLLEHQYNKAAIGAKYRKSALVNGTKEPV